MTNKGMGNTASVTDKTGISFLHALGVGILQISWLHFISSNDKHNYNNMFNSISDKHAYR